MKYRHLEDLRNKHKGEEIWVLGRGPSLDDYPTNFFDNRISIALSYAYLAFPNCTYFYSFHAEPAEYVAKNWPEKYSRCILGSIQDLKPGDKPRRNRYEKSGEVPVYARVKRIRDALILRHHLCLGHSQHDNEVHDRWQLSHGVYRS